MQATTFTKTGTKAPAKTKLNADVFGQKVTSTDLVQRAYLAVLAGQRVSSAKTKTRTMVRGGGRKPWQQKGTGNARAGSIRSPLWRGGGITFGPTGEENHKVSLSKTMRQKALKQALSLSVNKINVIETFSCKDGRVKPTVNLLKKMDTKGKTLIVVSDKDNLVDRATGNIPNVQAVQAEYLSINQVLDADTIIISKKSLEVIDNRLAVNKKGSAK